MARRLIDIKPKEVSLVERPAIRKRFYVTKEERDMEELIGLLKAIVGEVSKEETEVLKALSADTIDALKKALSLLGKYVADFPDDVKTAIATLAKFASYGYPAPKKETDEEKKVREAKEKEEKDKLEKQFGGIEKQLQDIAGQVKKTGEDLAGKVDAVKQVADGLEARVKKVEEIPGIKKSLDGQDGDPEPGKWPSFFQKEE